MGWTKSHDHFKIFEKFMKNNKDDTIMVDEIQQFTDRRSMPKMWASSKNSLTMYYY